MEWAAQSTRAAFWRMRENDKISKLTETWMPKFTQTVGRKQFWRQERPVACASPSSSMEPSNAGGMQDIPQVPFRLWSLAKPVACKTSHKPLFKFSFLEPSKASGIQDILQVAFRHWRLEKSVAGKTSCTSFFAYEARKAGCKQDIPHVPFRLQSLATPVACKTPSAY